MQVTGGDDSSGGADALAAVVLAGGRSTRFGSDKTRATVHGATLLQRVLGALDGIADEVVVVGTWAPAGVRVLREPTPGLGPLAGLAHGLRSVDAPRALVLAGDHPLLQPRLLELLCDRAVAGQLGVDRPGERGLDAVVPIGPHGVEPLVACYRTDLSAMAEERIASGRRSLRGFLDQLRVDRLDRAIWEVVDPQGWSFRDVDSPEDLDDLRTLQAQEE